MLGLRCNDTYTYIPGPPCCCRAAPGAAAYPTHMLHFAHRPSPHTCAWASIAAAAQMYLVHTLACPCTPHAWMYIAHACTKRVRVHRAASLQLQEQLTLKPSLAKKLNEKIRLLEGEVEELRATSRVTELERKVAVGWFVGCFYGPFLVRRLAGCWLLVGLAWLRYLPLQQRCCRMRSMLCGSVDRMRVWAQNPWGRLLAAPWSAFP